jgi:hypothetical protein
MTSTDRAMLMAINATPITTIHCRPDPKPVAARVVGAPGTVAPDPPVGGTDDVPDVDATAGVEDEAGVGDPVDAVPGGGDAAVGVVGGVVGPGGGEVDGGVGVVVGGVGGGVEILTTEKPPTPFPLTWPGDVSPTNVYSGEPL